MKLVQRYLTKNPVYKQAVKITPTQLILHSVGCNQPSAEVFIKLWDKNPPANKVAVHGIIDANTGTVYNLFPWNYRGAHAGGSANYHAIGVEMCESKYIKYKGASSEFTCTNKDEAKLLEGAADVDKEYVNVILPQKMEYNLKYISRFGFRRDIYLIFKTVIEVLK